MGVMNEGPQVMAILTNLGSALLRSELRTGAGRSQIKRLASTHWPKSGQSLSFLPMLGSPGSQ